MTLKGWEYIFTIFTLHDVCAVHRGVCSTPGDVQYTGACSVHWRMFSAPGDIMSTPGGVQYTGGYREYTGAYDHECGGYHEYTGGLKPFQSTLSHMKSTSVPRATFTRFLMEHGLFKYYFCFIDLPGG